MDQEQRQQCQQTADRMTVFCFISFTIGAYIIWVNFDQDAFEVPSTVFPMTVVGIVHLLGGSIAIFNAKKTRNFIRNIPVYGYFLLILVLAIWVISNGGKPF
jgi:hypothetical protein